MTSGEQLATKEGQLSIGIGLTSYGMYKDISHFAATKNSSNLEDNTETIEISVPANNGSSSVSSSIQSRRPTTSAEAGAMAASFEAQAAHYLEQARLADGMGSTNRQQLRAKAQQARQQAQAMREMEVSLAAKEAREAQAQATKAAEEAKAAAEKTEAISKAEASGEAAENKASVEVTEKIREAEDKKDAAEGRILKLEMEQAAFVMQQKKTMEILNKART